MIIITQSIVAGIAPPLRMSKFTKHSWSQSAVSKVSFEVLSQISHLESGSMYNNLIPLNPSVSLSIKWGILVLTLYSYYSIK